MSICDLHIIVDSDEIRKGHPWTFKNISKLKKNRKGKMDLVERPTLYKHPLRTGDYTLRYHENVFVIERKTAGDFMQCLGTRRKHFISQLERLQPLNGVVMIEMNEQDVLRGGYATQYMHSVGSWRVKYPNVALRFAGSRRAAECFSYAIMQKYMEHAIHTARKYSTNHAVIGSLGLVEEL